MWVRRAAIRPVPAYAKVPEGVLSRLEDDLSADVDDVEDASDLMNEALERFERDQPILADHMSERVGRYKKEPVVGVGYFLMIAVYLAFERAFPGEIDAIDETSLKSVEEALALDEEIRRVDPAEVVESDDVVAMEQPHVLRYVQDHVAAALETHADELDVDEVHAIYRAVLVETLALSYAVKAPKTSIPVETGEFSA
ncbi:MAG: hypothetical protein IPM79_20360 [Polyangiaceae bacterium]|nr:hypothetical protein [Polyangiaceae bacterium]MBK8939908.1 hypothetical protein [Polyangiaceae bacterium]